MHYKIFLFFLPVSFFLHGGKKVKIDSMQKREPAVLSETLLIKYPELLGNQKCQQNSLLHSVAAKGYINDVHILLSHGADTETRNIRNETPLHVAIRKGHILVSQKLIATMDTHEINFESLCDDCTDNPLHCAAHHGHAEIVESLLNVGMNPNVKRKKDGATALHIAAYEGHYQVIRKLLRHNVLLNCNNHCLFTPLHLAAAKGHVLIMQILIEEGARVNTLNYRKRIPLHDAVITGGVNAVHILLDAGAEPNAQDEWGKTPLMYALEKGHRSIVELLLAHGAQKNLFDNEGNITGRYDIYRLLMENKATLDPYDVIKEERLLRKQEIKNCEPPSSQSRLRALLQKLLSFVTL